MGNLGGYERITTVSKKVGGPGKLIAYVAVGGAVAGALAVIAAIVLLL